MQSKRKTKELAFINSVFTIKRTDLEVENCVTYNIFIRHLKVDADIYKLFTGYICISQTGDTVVKECQ